MQNHDKAQLCLFLILADNILLMRSSIQERSNEVFGGSIENTIRGRVLIGLSLKAIDSFDRLVVDARDGRSECSHHLKTMVESFIFSCWVRADPSDQSAKLLYAKANWSKAQYLEKYSDLVNSKMWAKAFGGLQKWALSGIEEKKWTRFKRARIADLAEQAKVQEYYNRIYKPSCEAAHIGDIEMYLPPEPTWSRGATLSHSSLIQCCWAIELGIDLACDVLQDASEVLKMEMTKQIDGFRKRSDEIQKDQPTRRRIARFYAES
jgi:hypothetical protein